MPKQNILKAFINAFVGIRYFFLHDRNGKIQMAVALFVAAIAVGLGVSGTEWYAILICIALVITVEMINSSIEQLCNVVQKEYHPLIKNIKDIAAGAVLFSCCLTAIIGVIIFLPKILCLL